VCLSFNDFATYSHKTVTNCQRALQLFNFCRKTQTKHLNSQKNFTFHFIADSLWGRQPHSNSNIVLLRCQSKFDCPNRFAETEQWATKALKENIVMISIHSCQNVNSARWQAWSHIPQPDLFYNFIIQPNSDKAIILI
jgi:hypothetical protein